MSESKTNPPSTPFRIGEIAFVWSPGSRNHLKEVTIQSNLVLRNLTNTYTGQVIPNVWVHDVKGPDLVFGTHGQSQNTYSCPPKSLRKRPGDEVGKFSDVDCLFKPKKHWKGRLGSLLSEKERNLTSS